VESIQQSGSHPLQLINDVLDVSVIEASKFDLHDGQFDVEEVIESVIQLVRQAAAVKEKTHTKSFNGLSLISGDSLRIKQIFVILLTNAVKFTPERGTIQISCHLDDQSRAVLSVSDTGMGRDQATIEQALEVFGRAEEHSLTNSDSTGLGLPLTRGLVQAHGGELRIDSTPATGVTITLPAERVFSGH